MPLNYDLCPVPPNFGKRLTYVAKARGVRGIIFQRSKVIFPDFFPVWNAFPGRKFTPPLFLTFPPSIFNFSKFSTFPFSIFFLFCSIFAFSIASRFPVGQQKFPGQKSLGGHSAPAPPPPPVTFLAKALPLGRLSAESYKWRVKCPLCNWRNNS